MCFCCRTMNKSIERIKRLEEFFLWSPVVVVVFWLIEKASWYWINRPDMQFGWVVPVLAGYVLFEVWRDRPEIKTQWRVGILAGLILGMVCLFVTQIYQAAYGLTSTSMSGLGIGYIFVVFSYLTYLYGFWGVRVFGFGFAFLLISLPLPNSLQVSIIAMLQNFISNVTVEFLLLIGIPAAVLQGSLINLVTGVVGIDEACSGVRSLQSSVMVSLFIGYLSLRKWISRCALLMAGVIVAVLGNLIRVFWLSWAASTRGLDAVDITHDTAGWSILLFTIVGVGVFSWLFSRLESSFVVVGEGVNDPVKD